MLKRVWLDLQYIPENEIVGLGIRLKNEGLEVITGKSATQRKQKETINREREAGEILVTDNREGEALAEKYRIPCLGLERTERLGMQYVMLDSRGVTGRYLERVYRRFYGVPWEILETERCRIREMELADMDKIYRLYDGDIACYVERPYEDRSKEAEYMKEHIAYMYGFFEYGLWLAIEKETEEIVGRVGICNREIDGTNEPEIGYIVGKAWQRKGYGYELCKAVLQYAKEELELQFLNCFVEKENLASLGLAKKLGFTEQEEQGSLCWFRKNL